VELAGLETGDRRRYAGFARSDRSQEVVMVRSDSSGRTRTAVLATVTALAFAALGPGQAAAGEANFTLRASKSHDGPYETFSRVGIRQGQAKTTWWRVKSKSHSNQQSMSFSGLGGDHPGYKVTWFKGKRKITDDVESTGYEFDLAAGQAKYFTSRIKRTGPEESACVDARVWDEGHTMASDASMGVNTRKCLL
jgi:hypothetical protein